MHKQAVKEAAAFVDSWLGYRMSQLGHDIPGMTVAVWLDGRVVLSQAYGLADVASGRPMAVGSVFSAASHTKMFTATVVLQLAAAGKLALDEPVCTYLPWLSAHPDARMGEITIRQLLCHGAGLARDGRKAEFWGMEQPFPDAAGLQQLALETRLVLEPNTTLKYSNLGYALLGQVVEVAGSQPWAKQVAAVIRAAGLQATTPDWTPAVAGQLVTGYGRPVGGKRTPLQRTAAGGAFASAIGLCTTAEDLCRFAAAQCRGNQTLLSHTWQKEAQRSQMTVADGYDTGLAFGLGFELMRCGARRLVGHSGHLGGQTTATWFDPQAGMAVSVLTNAKGVPINLVVRGIFEAFDHFSEHVTRPTPPERARLQGRYCNQLAGLEVVAAGDNLLLIDPDDWEPFTWPEELEQISPTHYRVTTKGSAFGEGEDVLFRLGRDGRVRSVRYAGSPLLPETK